MNRQELALLERDPGALVDLYRPMIKQIVVNFVSSGMFRSAEINDVMQHVILELLQKIPVIRKKYNGTTLLRTYVSSIVRNSCLRLKELEERQPPTSPLEHRVESPEPGIDDRIILREIRDRFDVIIRLFDSQRPKLLLALKIFYQIPISPEDVTCWYPNAGTETRDALARLFAGPTAEMIPNHVYKLVVPLLNALEGKSNSSDAFRKWSAARIDEIIGLLNGYSKGANFDRESLRELVEDFFSPFLLER